MTEEQRYFSLRTNKLCLSFWDKVMHFSIVIALLIIPLAGIFFLLASILSGSSLSSDKKTLFLYFITIPIIPAFLLYKLQSGRLKFKEVSTTLSRQQLKDIIKKVRDDLKWRFVEANDNFIIAKTLPSSWGEQVTILFDSNRVLINSICDPDRRNSLVSFGYNKENTNRLVEEIEKASRVQK